MKTRKQLSNREGQRRIILRDLDLANRIAMLGKLIEELSRQGR